MELWYTEEHTPTVRFSIKIKKQLFGGKSPFQQIDVFDSEEFGRFFTLDGLMMLTATAAQCASSHAIRASKRSTW